MYTMVKNMYVSRSCEARGIINQHPCLFSVLGTVLDCLQTQCSASKYSVLARREYGWLNEELEELFI